MGISYNSSAVIGVKIDLACLVTSERVKAFEHEYSEDFTYDPQSGKPLWVWKDVPKDGVVTLYEGESVDSGCTVCGYNVMLSKNNSAVIYMHRTDRVEGEGANPIASCKLPENIEELRQRMRETLSAKGFWSEADFGLHVVMWYS